MAKKQDNKLGVASFVLGTVSIGIVLGTHLVPFSYSRFIIVPGGLLVLLLSTISMNLYVRQGKKYPNAISTAGLILGIIAFIWQLYSWIPRFSF